MDNTNEKLERINPEEIEKILKIIESYYNNYYNEILLKNDIENNQIAKYQSDWFEALKFFWGRTFYRGRPDELSTRYKNYALCVLFENKKIIENNDANFSEIIDDLKTYKENKKTSDNAIKKYYNKPNFIKLSNKYDVLKLFLIPKKDFSYNGFKDNEKRKKGIFINNFADLLLIFDSLNFISKIDDHNIYNYLCDKLTKDKNFKNSYDELIGIEEIGDKLATLVLRDLCFLDKNINAIDCEKKYRYTFPIDTWVNQVMIENLRYKNNNQKEEKIKIDDSRDNIIKSCEELEIDPRKYNAGAWYIGKNSLKILLNHFKNNKINFLIK
jgi:hypothetical protein